MNRMGMTTLNNRVTLAYIMKQLTKTPKTTDRTPTPK